MHETGFYAFDTWQADLGRVAAVARYVNDAVVYTRRPSELLEYHHITNVVPRCPGQPAGHEMSPLCLERWLIEQNPERLVVDSYAYGRRNELRRYVEAKRDTVSFLAQDDTSAVARDFRTVIKTEPCPGPGEDLYPLFSTEPHELPSRIDARRLLGAGDQPLVLFLGTGTSPDFQTPTTRLCEELGIDAVAHTSFPVLPAMVAADLVIGYAGHHQIEAEALGVEMLAVRNYHDPRRTAPGATWQDIREALTRLASQPVGAPRVARRAGITNQARRAAALISGDPGWRQADG